MSLFVSRLSSVRQATALVTGLLTGVFFVGCNRDSSPKAETKTAAAAPAAGTATSKTAVTSTSGAPGATPATSSRRGSDSEKDKARQYAAEMIPVETAIITRGAISAFLPFNATLETEAVVDIYPQTNGQVEALMVEEGRVVKEGDPLLKIEDRELRVDVEEATANYDHLKRNFGRTEDLYQRNLINRQDYETQSYQMEQARLRLERAKIRLSYATVRAPFAGVVSAREAQVGARVATGTKLFSMVKLDDIVARVYVPGRYLPIVAENQTAIVTSEFLPDRIFEGWVKRISPVIDPKSGTFKVTVGVRSENRNDLPPGLFVAVRVITDTRPTAVLLPKRAVVYEGGERFAFTVSNGRAVKRKLVAGYEDPNNIEAVSGFEVGSPVIVLGHNGLKDGAPVREVNALAPIPQPPDDEASKPASLKTTASSAEPNPSKS